MVRRSRFFSVVFILFVSIALTLVLASCAPGGGSGSDAIGDSPTPTHGFNLDFGTTYTGLPNTYVAASGQGGFWANLGYGTTPDLTDTLGNPTTASLTVTGREDAGGPGISLSGSILLGDSFMGDPVLFGNGDLSVTISGLENGAYDLYYYSPLSVTSMSVNGSPMPALSGGDQDVLIVPPGSNWEVITVVVTDGTLTIIDNIGANEGLSGIQLVPI